MRSKFTFVLFSVALALTATLADAETTHRKKGLFSFLFNPHHSNHQTTAPADEGARAEVKAAVQVAIENRPRGRIWCVPFARAVSGVELRGNARTWWAQAAGKYERGNEPTVGAVMNFAASRAMPKGHVAVVSQVVNERQILVDQANWERNRITQDTLVVDVSANNDWSAVRVANAAGTLGRTNPVYGFIYN